MNKCALLNPKLRFKGFSGEWEELKLSNIIDYERPDKFIVKSTEYLIDNSLIPVLTANKGFILGYTNEIDFYNKGECIIFDDFTMDFKYVSFNFKVKSSAIKILTSKNNFNLKFIYSLWLKQKFIPLGHNRHYISIVQEMKFKIPSLEEQTKIAKFFTLLDKQIDLLVHKLQLLEVKKKYYLNNLFCSNDSLNPKLRFKGFVGELSVANLGMISKLSKGSGMSKVEIDNDGINYCILYGELFTKYKWNISTVFSKTNSQYKKRSTDNDLLIPGSSTSIDYFFPFCSISLENIILGSDVNIFTINKNYSNKYIALLFSKWTHTKNIYRYSEGSTINHLYGNDIIKYKFRVTNDLNEQTKIAKFFTLLDEQIENNKNKKEKLLRIKSFYLNNMFI